MTDPPTDAADDMVRDLLDDSAVWATDRASWVGVRDSIERAVDPEGLATARDRTGWATSLATDRAAAAVERIEERIEAAARGSGFEQPGGGP